jgi:hypothetical protein
MSARADNRWNARSAAVAVALPYSPGFDIARMREKLAVVRDTLIVLGVQIAFRAAMLLRRFNY